MKSFILAPAILALFLLAPARGAEPTSRPTLTRPAILILPFTAIASTEKTNWIAQALQQNMVSELTRSRMSTPVTPTTRPNEPTTDIASAKRAGEESQTALVLFGSYQVNGSQIRITGQLIDVATGGVVGAIRATGPVRDLFALEDTMAEQCKRLVREATGAPSPLAVVPVVPQTIQDMAGKGGFAVRPTGPLRDDRIERDPELAYLRDKVYYGDYSESYYRYNRLYGPIFNYGYCYPSYWGAYRGFSSSYYNSTSFGYSGSYIFRRGYIRFNGSW